MDLKRYCVNMKRCKEMKYTFCDHFDVLKIGVAKNMSIGHTVVALSEMIAKVNAV